MSKGSSRVVLIVLLVLLGMVASLLQVGKYLSVWEEELSSESTMASDLMVSLACYAALNKGRLPISEAQFRSSDVVMVSAKGAVYLREPAVYAGQYGSFGNSIITDLSKYDVAWGQNLDVLRVEAGDRLVDASGNEVRLITVMLPGILGMHDMGRHFSWGLVDFYRHLLHESKAMTQPSSHNIDARSSGSGASTVRASPRVGVTQQEASKRVRSP